MDSERFGSARSPRGILLACLLAAWFSSASAQPAFKITFAAQSQNHGRVWNGGVDDASRLRGMLGWHLHDDDRLRPPSRWDVMTQSVGGDVASPGVILTLNGPESLPFTFFTRIGDTTFVPAEVPYGEVYYPPGLRGDIAIERVPHPIVVSGQQTESDDPAMIRTRSGEYWLAWVAYRTVERDGYYLKGADRVMAAWSEDGVRWSEPSAVTSMGDHFRVALGEDAHGRIWCVYSRQEALGSGNFDLYAKSLEHGRWSDAVRLTEDPRPDAFHRVAATGDGELYLVWAGFRDSPDGGPPQSDILLRRFDGSAWGPEVPITDSPEDDWEPAVATDSAGRAWIAWDSYRSTGGYDLLLRSATAEDEGPLVELSASPYSEMRADVAVDRADRVWVAWEEGAPNWGKDYGYRNPRHRINLKQGALLYDAQNARPPRVAVLEDGQWLRPREALPGSVPKFLRPGLFQNPRLAVDGEGNAWVVMRHQWRGAGRWGGHLFDSYATTWADGGWISPVLLPGSTGRQDTLVATAPAPDGSIVAAVVGDGRRLPVGLPKHHAIAVVRLDGNALPGTSSSPPLVPFEPSVAEAFVPTHPNEDAEIDAIRDHRVELDGLPWKIVRGDLHRHTEISMDGATDGTLNDAYRYALNAAQLDFLGVSDHNYGQWLDTDQPTDPQSDNEFQFWRTQKSVDLFHVPGRFTPLYGYERTTNFPLGHRNIFHATRGVFSLRVPMLHVRDRPELLDSDPPKLWAYLRRTGGIGIPHTSATSMGTNWQRRDDEVIPVTEIYQGDRNSYETQGGPRAALPDAPGMGSAGRPPHQDGLVQNALGVGYRMGFIASSDHRSTHISYANLIVPDRITTRADLIDAMRNRRTFASTDNIAVDFHSGGQHQGSVTVAAEAPVFTARIRGTAPILKVEVIKNNRSVYTRSGDGELDVEFEYRDAEFDDTSMGATATVQDWSRPETGIRPRPDPTESYYYLRVIQSFSADEPDKEGEIAWSSPIFVTRE